MNITEALLLELTPEMANTRKTLERVPHRPEFAPHAKSAQMGKLAAHVAQLPEFGLTIVEMPEYDFAMRRFNPLKYESAQQLVDAFDKGSQLLRRTVGATPEKAWSENWKLSFDGKIIFQGQRILAYREMFLNHLVHHRAQLGVYLRMNDIAVPSIYGPSADEPFA